MRKYCLFVFFLFFSLSLYAELSKEQLWAISLTGLMSEINSSFKNCLNVDVINDENKEKWLKVLNRDWNINNKDELLQTLRSVENGGHAAVLKVMQEVIDELKIQELNDSVINKVIKPIINQRQYNYLMFTLENWDVYYNKTIIAWDLGRNISLCRWGYQVGFLKEEEAWELIMYYARKIQLRYSSWNEYGYDYYLGRIFFASGFNEENQYRTRTAPLFTLLITGYWSQLEWYINLLPINQNENKIKVETIRYKKPSDNDGTMQFKTNDPIYYNKYLYEIVDNPNDDKNIFQCKVKKISGNSNYGFGIMFCIEDSAEISYYRIFITTEGTYVVQKRAEGKIEALIKWNYSFNLNKGLNAYNDLRVERIDSEGIATFHIYFNDKLEISFEDNSPLNGNKTGLVTSVNTLEKELFPHIPVDVRFYY